MKLPSNEDSTAKTLSRYLEEATRILAKKISHEIVQLTPEASKNSMAKRKNINATDSYSIGNIHLISCLAPLMIPPCSL